MNLVPLYEEAIQFNDYNGTVLAAGKVEVWYLGRTRLADIYSDVAGEVPLPNPFNLNDLGMQEVYVNPAFNYTLVVYDAYNSELFSVDKYIQGAGDHNTSNVVVQPSEHIGVSAWTVGDVQIYQPYIQGELGKTYHGIEPIVVNNQENKISARNIPLGVQEPLYFVEDSESACIIGASGLAYQSSVNYVSGIVDTKYDATAADSKLDSADFTAYQEEVGNTFEAVGNDFNYLSGAIDDVVSGAHADIDFLSGKVDTKLDTTAFSTVSGNFLTAHQSLTAYATTADVNDLAQSISETYQPKGDYQTAGDYYSASNPSGFITGVDLTPYMEASKLETADGKITGYDGTAFAGGGSVDPSEFIPWSASGEFQSAGNYATTDDLTAYQEKGDYYSASNPSGFINSDAISAMATTGFVADVSADITAMIPTALTGDYLTKDSADTLYYGIDNPSGFITGVDLTPYQTTADMTAYQPVGDYLTTGDSANFYTTANESGFITGVDLTPYQLTADMTAYQEAGDYYSASNPSGFITGVDLTPYQTTAGMTGYMTTGDSAEFMTTAERADFYTTANESGFITGVPSESSGLWQTASETVTANSGVWGGSALPISAGLGIKFEMVDGTLVASTSGYVWQSALLFHTDTPVTQTTYTLSENCSNYDKLEVDFYDINNYRTMMECLIPPNLAESGTRGGYFSLGGNNTGTASPVWFKCFNWNAAGTTWTCYCSEIAAQGGSTTQTVNANQPDNPPKVINIIGWKRVGGN